jgi:hypothetical protein
MNCRRTVGFAIPGMVITLLWDMPVATNRKLNKFLLYYCRSRFIKIEQTQQQGDKADCRFRRSQSLNNPRDIADCEEAIAK